MYLHTGSFVCTSHVSIYIRLRRLLILIRAHRVCLSVACHLRWRNAKWKDTNESWNIVAKSQKRTCWMQLPTRIFQPVWCRCGCYIYIYMAVCVHAFPSHNNIQGEKERSQGNRYGKLLLLLLYDFMDYSLVVFLACIIRRLYRVYLQQQLKGQRHCSVYMYPTMGARGLDSHLIWLDPAHYPRWIIK
jgi:hypothetical protein